MAATIRAEEITSIIQQEIEGYQTVLDVKEVGTVLSVGDGIARIHGLEKVMYGELIEFPHDVVGIAMNLEEDNVGAVILGEFAKIKSGDQVRRTKRIMSVPVGEELVGRVLNAIGEPLDGKGPVASNQLTSAVGVACSVRTSERYAPKSVSVTSLPSF